MDERNQFTFYRSFWEAVKGLPKKDRLPILESIIEYALDGKAPSGLSQSQSAFFLLVKPNLDAARKKSANGKQGGSKPKANRKQTPSDISEGEGEGIGVGKGEGYGEGEGEKHPLSDGSLFTAFWNAYPENARSDREGAWEAWKKLNPTQEKAAQIMDFLGYWKVSKRWTDDGGAFIPAPKNFLNPDKSYLRTKPAPANNTACCNWPDGKRPLDEDDIAAIRRLMKETEETEA